MIQPILWYFADPMCSWCWGFSPVMEAVREIYRPRLKIALVLGGLRPGETVPLTATGREEILHHWHQVKDRTGQAFRFENALPDGFVYDTEPPSRAVIAVAGIVPGLIFDMFRSIQSAFYTDGRNVTKPETLADLAEQVGVASDSFLQAFESEAVRAKTLAHFRHARQAGVRGFPSLILQQDTQLHPIVNGYSPLQELITAIDSRLDP